jgi:hypothetical protein
MNQVCNHNSPPIQPASNSNIEKLAHAVSCKPTSPPPNGMVSSPCSSNHPRSMKADRKPAPRHVSMQRKAHTRTGSPCKGSKRKSSSKLHSQPAPICLKTHTTITAAYHTHLHALRRLIGSLRLLKEVDGSRHGCNGRGAY